MGRRNRHLLFARGHAHLNEERNDFLWCDSITQCRPPEVTSIAMPFTIPLNNTFLKLRGVADKSLVRPGRKQAMRPNSGFIQHTPHEAQYTS